MSGLLLLVAVACLVSGCSHGTSGMRSDHIAGAPSEPDIPAFDAARSFQYLVRQVNLGPRVPGSASHAECLNLFEREFRSTADTVVAQPFEIDHAVLGKLALTNLIVRFRPSDPRRLLFTAHWDSRPWADNDPDLARRSEPVPGANDGASGCAVLLELAHALRLVPPAVGVDIVLFDGEDLGTPGITEGWCLGSRYFAKHLTDAGSYLAAVNLDMVGAEGLVLRREAYSDEHARPTVELVMTIAQELGFTAFRDEPGLAIQDDHLPLQRAGIAAIDLVDIDYRVHGTEYWHTTGDTADKCSPESLRQVGTVLLHLTYRSFSQNRE